MDVPVDASHKLAPDIEPPILLPTISLEVINDSRNAKVEDPPPQVDIPFSDAKVEDAPMLVVPLADAHPSVGPVVVSNDH